MYSENFCKSNGHITYVSLQNDGTNQCKSTGGAGGSCM